MKNQESEFFIDKGIVKYQALSITEKTIINLTGMVYLVLFSIGLFYNGGEAIGEFLYQITH